MLIGFVGKNKNFNIKKNLEIFKFWADLQKFKDRWGQFDPRGTAKG